jgi:hypothetical protein
MSISKNMQDAQTRDDRERARIMERYQGAQTLLKSWNEPTHSESNWTAGPNVKHYQENKELVGTAGSKYTVNAGTARANSYETVLKINKKLGDQGLE